MNERIQWTEAKASMCGGGKLRREYFAGGKLGRDHACSNAHGVEAGYNFNGSGGTAFGGAAMWPVVKAKIAFQEGQDAERDAFAEALKDFVSDYFAPKEGVPLRDLPKRKAGQAAKKQ
jgi:hypothetical protein